MKTISRKLASFMLSRYALTPELFSALNEQANPESNPSIFRTVILSYAAYKFGHKVTVLKPKSIPETKI